MFSEQPPGADVSSIDLKSEGTILTEKLLDERVVMNSEGVGRTDYWEPDLTREKPPDDFENYLEQGYKECDFVDLQTIPAGSVIVFGGKNMSASYMLRKEENGQTVKVWRPLVKDKLVALTGPISAIGTIGLSQEDGSVMFYPEMLIKNGVIKSEGKAPYTNMVMPYFHYDESGMVSKPDKTWKDTVSYIYLKNPKVRDEPSGNL